jgi:hypothetical protein
MRDPESVSINMSAIPVAGIGGLGLVAIAAIIAIEFPLVRAVTLSGGLVGILAGVSLIFFRRRQRKPL